VNDLSSLGFGLFFRNQFDSLDGPRGVPARVASEHRGLYEVWSASARGSARLCGKLWHELDEPARPTVGDWVLLERAPEADGIAVIERLLARRTLFARAAAGRSARVQTIAANVDLVFVVCGLDGDYNVRRLDRYIARVRASGAEPLIVLSKADLCSNVEQRIAELARIHAGVPIDVTSTRDERGIGTLRTRVEPGVTVALVGSSGAGKSTLVNALLGEARMATGQVRVGDARGRHTTTSRQLVLLPDGGLLLDTPGMRELSLLDEQGLEQTFGELAALAERCRYGDCRHQSEPGCAVREAAARGELDPDRLAHFAKLQREAQAAAQRHEQRDRRRAERAGGRLSDEMAQVRRWKGGKP
jgi:ribosome biogenesis GTPase / thiamine phosphate phosphatase